jgi:hypothetical protein
LEISEGFLFFSLLLLLLGPLWLPLWLFSVFSAEPLVDEEVEDKALSCLWLPVVQGAEANEMSFQVSTQLSYSAGTLHDPMAMALVSMEDGDEDG